jgi:hypothetical protein
MFNPLTSRKGTVKKSEAQTEGNVPVSPPVDQAERMRQLMTGKYKPPVEYAGGSQFQTNPNSVVSAVTDSTQKSTKKRESTQDRIDNSMHLIAKGGTPDTGAADYQTCRDKAVACSDGANTASAKAMENSWDPATHSFAKDAHGLAIAAHTEAAKKAKANGDAPNVAHHEQQVGVHQAAADMHDTTYNAKKADPMGVLTALVKKNETILAAAPAKKAQPLDYAQVLKANPTGVNQYTAGWVSMDIKAKGK